MGVRVRRSDTHWTIGMWVPDIQRVKQSKGLWKVKGWVSLKFITLPIECLCSAIPPLQTEALYYLHFEFRNAMCHKYVNTCVCVCVCVCVGGSMLVLEQSNFITNYIHTYTYSGKMAADFETLRIEKLG